MVEEVYFGTCKFEISNFHLIRWCWMSIIGKSMAGTSNLRFILILGVKFYSLAIVIPW